MRLFTFLVLFTICLFSCNDQNSASSGDHQDTNMLIHETSPYLLQHAHNPVNWHPWNEATLEKAIKEDKMLVISIGYAACHWCHVMEEESFMDTTVSRIMNEHFIAVKVDREERPDVDDIYMTACQMSSQQGCGWPLNVFALPNAQPVWTSTYLPKKRWLETVNYFAEAYQNDKAKMEQYAADLTNGMAEQNQISISDADIGFSKESMDLISSNILQRVDYLSGGKKGAPKFPLPNIWNFLLKLSYLEGNEQALEAVTTTLDEMAYGGIYDHLGGGFARYSVDGNWHVPHFEKMLYDNGQLVSIYASAYKMTGKDLYRQRIVETLDFIEKNLTNEIGGFYSSLNADSEGEEGKFYVWHKNEIDSLLSQEEATVFNEFYHVKETGNWEEGKNILFTREDMEAFAQNSGKNAEEIKTVLSSSKQKLFDARSQRIKPSLDDKVLTSWNALMLKGYADAFAALGEESYREAAIKNGNFILENMMGKDGRLARNYKNGKTSINAFAVDYALTIQAFVSLYQITFEEKWLDQADKLTQYALSHFFDEKSGMFNYTSDLDKELIVRKVEITDGVIPGSNSIMAKNLFELGTLLYKEEFVEKAKQMMAGMEEKILENGGSIFYTDWCSLYLDMLHPPYEVAIVGEDYAGKRDDLLKTYLPNAILLGGAQEGKLELLKDKLQEGETMIYVCMNKVCKLPVTEVEDALGLLE